MLLFVQRRASLRQCPSIVAKGRALIGGNLKKNFPRCQMCWAENLCFGCFGPGIQEFNHVSTPPEYFCSIIRGMTFGTITGLIREWKLDTPSREHQNISLT